MPIRKFFLSMFYEVKGDWRRSQRPWKLPFKESELTERKFGYGTIIRSEQDGRLAWCLRKSSRIMRFTRFRMTALPIFRPTLNPSLGHVGGLSRILTCTRKPSWRNLFPAFCTARKAWSVHILWRARNRIDSETPIEITGVGLTQ